jgi:signal transduction histidine kinase
MNKRFWIICSVIGLALGVLSALGLSSLGMYRKGLHAERQQEFMDVARQISFDVKKKVDAFLQAEQNRLYTDYQPYYVPEISNQTAALVPSPLANLYSNSFATGYFQLESDGRITSPHLAQTQIENDKKPAEYALYFENVQQNLLPSLQNGQTLATHRIEPTEREKKDEYSFDRSTFGMYRRTRTAPASPPLKQASQVAKKIPEQREFQKPLSQKPEALTKSKGATSRRSVYPISSLEKNRQTTQVLNQRRDNYEVNVISNEATQVDDSVSQAVQSYNSARGRSEDMAPQQAHPKTPRQAEQQSSLDFSQPAKTEARYLDEMVQRETQSEAKATQERFGHQRQLPDMKDNDMLMMDMMIGIPGGGIEQPKAESESVPVDQPQAPQADTVQVRIEPFVPMTVLDSNGGNGIFAGQIYLLRHVQIEDRHLVQGFQLNEDELLSQVAESAKELLRRGMGYEISKVERDDAAFAAILQFDFGEVVLNLLETDPGFIQAQVLRIRNWFFGILGVVWLAVLVAMAALWKNMHEQVLLSRKKDDFISAVSHELRTPLTSIRMYTEMLEKDWVKTDDKRREYYTTMRQESERLSRLIENVLDFSRIQRGKKRYDFSIGDVNECIGEVAEMMRPYVERAGFTLVQEFTETAPFMFDPDAIAQIVINLVDNALKYAKAAEDKRIIVRTQRADNMVLIEVEDHGPGIPRNQQKKIFDAFYRCEDESTRQSTGTGLGLALVKRFAEAHNGFVEIANAKPSGALFRIGLTTR